MKRYRIVAWVVVFVVTASLVQAQSRAGRGAGRGAAMGAVWGLIFGGGIEGAVEGAAAGAAVGAVGGAVSGSYARKDARRAQQQHEQAQARAQAEVERKRLEEERLRLEAERLALEEEAHAQTVALEDSISEEEWIAQIGVDNWNALVALTDCQHERALLLAQAGATIDDPEYRLASHWIETLVYVDQKQQDEAAALFPILAELDPDVDTVQQVSLEADKAVLEIRDVRRDEGIVCTR